MNDADKKFSNIEECTCPKCKDCKVFTIEGEICVFCRHGNHVYPP